MTVFVFCLFVFFLFISHFGFKSGIWLLIAPVAVHCFSITFRRTSLLYCITLEAAIIRCATCRISRSDIRKHPDIRIVQLTLLLRSLNRKMKLIKKCRRGLLYHGVHVGVALYLLIYVKNRKYTLDSGKTYSKHTFRDKFRQFLWSEILRFRWRVASKRKCRT